jgi:hypothetical protein
MPEITPRTIRNAAENIPPMMQVMKEIGGIEFPETLAKIQEPDSVKKPKESPKDKV